MATASRSATKRTRPARSNPQPSYWLGHGYGGCEIEALADEPAFGGLDCRGAPFRVTIDETVQIDLVEG